MKVISAEEMSRIEEISYEKEDSAIASIYMENAGKAVYKKIIEAGFLVNKKKSFTKIVLVCGKGNNAGDAYVCGRYLLQDGYDVKAIQLAELDTCSKLCYERAKEFEQKGGSISTGLDHFNVSEYDLIIDGILGIGFKGKLKKIYCSIIEKINKSKKNVVSIDVPSGLDASSGYVDKSFQEPVKSSVTVSLGLLKTGFFLGYSPEYIGKLSCVEFGLREEYIKQAKSQFEFVLINDMKGKLPIRSVQAHKYNVGYVCAISGSEGMVGASWLASKACFRAGAGIVKLFTRKEALLESDFFPELIKSSYEGLTADILSKKLNTASSVFIGPGIGLGPSIAKLISELIPKINVPLVLDADAITLYARKPFVLPKNCIMTPHLGELRRLLGDSSIKNISKEILLEVNEFCKKNKVIIIVKGYPSFVVTGYCSTSIHLVGDAGMATAGCGDVLTGIVSSMLAQGLDTRMAANFAVFLHGLSGTLAAKEIGSRSMMASDIIDFLPKALSYLK
jgi:ADP-dependent NAD(P)H-hydrate dehydratase / NAD(P)H-hydrate epimerase